MFHSNWPQLLLDLLNQDRQAVKPSTIFIAAVAELALVALTLFGAGGDRVIVGMSLFFGNLFAAYFALLMTPRRARPPSSRP